MRFSIEQLRKHFGATARRSGQETADEIAPGPGELSLQAGPGSVNEQLDVHPQPADRGQAVEIGYNGVLSRQGASQVYVHYGYGPGPWREVQDAPMQRAQDGTWKTRVVPAQAGSLELCFRDDAYHWDNNEGRNWSVPVRG